MVELHGRFSNYVWAESTWFDFQGLARWLAMLQPGGIWMHRSFNVGLSENSVPLFTQWFCWSLSLWKMAISLGRLTQHFQTYPCFKMLVLLLPRTLNATIVIRPDGLLPALRGRGPCIWPDSGCLPALRHGGLGVLRVSRGQIHMALSENVGLIFPMK